MKIGYARVSTPDQNLDRQIDALEEAGCERIYSEELSGAAQVKPELDKAFDAVREGDQFVVTRLERMGRDLKDLILRAEDLEERGAHLEVLKQNIDTSTPEGRFYFHLFGALAQFERDRINARRREGLQSAAERGREGGRPPKLDNADVDSIAALMKDDDYTVAQICEKYGISSSTLYEYVNGEGEVIKYPYPDKKEESN